jgi:GTP cyclohydrolase II
VFTYIDPSVRQRLIAQGKLIRIDAHGREISATAAPCSDGIALNLLGPIALPIERGGLNLTVDWYVAVRHTELHHVERFAAELTRHGDQASFGQLVTSMAVTSVLVSGDVGRAANPLTRVHSSCLTGDVFGSLRCECGPQLVESLHAIANDDAGGLLIYMAGHEGRGIGLWAKAATYLLQDAGEDTYQANRSLGLPDDSRDYSDAAALLHFFVGDRPFRLLTNNPKKVKDLTALGLRSITAVKHVVGVGSHNRGYLAAKRAWGHALDARDLEEHVDGGIHS